MKITLSSASLHHLMLLYRLLYRYQQKSLKRLVNRLEAVAGAEGGTRTPMPFRAQRPERCVSTSFTTSAEVSCGQGYHTVTLANCQEVFWGFGLGFA